MELDLAPYLKSNMTASEKEADKYARFNENDNTRAFPVRRQGYATRLALEKLVAQRIITKLVKILLMIYKSQIRQSWMEGPTTAEANDALHNELINIFGDKLHTEKEILGIKFKE